ncbi:GD13277 [Drosophila simulans]|uniref:GD13277 n=1 Tax=Drosophila simulans TaxID=7240 RepID=B4QQI1_DROSI|nr:GD13277 [Drosophila simulans]
MWVLPGVTTTVWMGTCSGMSKTGFKLEKKSAHGDVAGIVGHHQVVGGTGQSRHPARNVLGAQTAAVDAVHVHRVRGVIQSTKCNVTCA